jgi:hypothetical protein
VLCLGHWTEIAPFLLGSRATLIEGVRLRCSDYLQEETVARFKQILGAVSKLLRTSQAKLCPYKMLRLADA